MPLAPSVLKTWQEIQKKFDYPVNAIGVKIHPKDHATLKTWLETGVDKLMKK